MENTKLSSSGKGSYGKSCRSMPSNNLSKLQRSDATDVVPLTVMFLNGQMLTVKLTIPWLLITGLNTGGAIGNPGNKQITRAFVYFADQPILERYEVPIQYFLKYLQGCNLCRASVLLPC